MRDGVSRIVWLRGGVIRGASHLVVIVGLSLLHWLKFAYCGFAVHGRRASHINA